MEERLLTTFDSTADVQLWVDFPIAVDGWACTRCSGLVYPRPLSAEVVDGWGRKGVEAATQGEESLAEFFFTRVVWGWPGYYTGHVNYAEVTRMRLGSSARMGFEHLELLERRALLHYELAERAWREQPDVCPQPLHESTVLNWAGLLARAGQTERLRMVLSRTLALPGVSPRTVKAAATILESVAPRH